MHDSRDGATEGRSEVLKRLAVHHIHGVVVRLVAGFSDGVERDVHVATSRETLPSTVPFHHGHFAALTGVNETLSKGILLLHQLVF